MPQFFQFEKFRKPLSKLVGIIFAIGVISCIKDSADAQFVYEGGRMDVKYKVYVYKKHSLGDGKWKFQTKTVFGCTLAHSSICKPGEAIVSGWRIADCHNATIDGKIVPVSSRFGYEEGEPEVFRSVCQLR